MYRITGYIEKDSDSGMYVAIVPGIPGAHTQAATLDELQKNLKEVVELCLEEMDPEGKSIGTSSNQRDFTRDRNYNRELQ